MLVLSVRTLVLYIIIVFGLRLMGKRQLGELQPSELVVTILISNIATLPIEESSVPLLSGITPILLLVCFEILVSFFSLKFRWARRIISGQPIVVIEHGRINEKQLRDLRFSIDDLMEELRSNDIFDVREVELAVVETNGKLTVHPKFSARPLTPEMIGLTKPTNDCPPPAVVISDGELIEKSLNECNLKREWLDGQLAQQGLTIRDIFLMVCDTNATYFMVPKEKTGHKAVEKK